MFSHNVTPDVRTRILLVEDSRPMQETLTAILSGMDHLQLVSIAETASEAVDHFNKLQPHAVILDLGLREGTGFDVLYAIKGRRPDCRVLVFTSYDAEPYRLRCLAAGADHFFSKNRQHSELLQELSQFSAR